MRGVYADKCAILAHALRPLADYGWTWENNTVGVQLMLRHADTKEVQRIAESSGLSLHLLNSYRHRPADDDGLLLRFGGLSVPTIRSGIERLVSAARSLRRR